MAVNKERINDLINRLSEKDLELVTDLMERLAQNRSYDDIPVDDEPTTQEDLDAIKNAHEALKRGDLISLKDIEHELRS
ncbi:hypothetical protein MJA45_02475 [Paenibacillus aurantius]|uniref:Uncharacterized protein n=1 Tax=Paenibacillus aurantius TaxID=2918900 RepID=A0AA96LEX0_9BACL|nr:hypothetical protein [Paenibacillus aurantius]WJH36609.1 hypothetical protein N6H14_13185 [Paenibacillus sp. CC-CFT747]WNQ11944.1 hypothetical protein MJA45_02475 [Paenibacillus aurantius]